MVHDVKGNGSTERVEQRDSLGPEDRAKLVNALLTWYRGARRDLPWRRSPSPYAVWVSEIMLQQTQVAAVLPYYERFMDRFPTVEALAEGSDEEVISLWEGLGYYSRARNLHAGARQVVDRFGGKVPQSVRELREIPGIGAYTAGAVASIAHGLPEPLIDGNVVRVLTRIFGLTGDPARMPMSKALWQLAGALVPRDAPGDFNQALMELGATICVPRSPACPACPVQRHCMALREGKPERYPQTAIRPRTTRVRAVALLVRNPANELLVIQRPDQTRWRGLWQFPSRELTSDEPFSDGARALLSELHLVADSLRPLGEIKHGVTRFSIRLAAFAARAEMSPGLQLPYRWLQTDGLAAVPLPKPHRRLIDLEDTPGTEYAPGKQLSISYESVD